MKDFQALAEKVLRFERVRIFHPCFSSFLVSNKASSRINNILNCCALLRIIKIRPTASVRAGSSRDLFEIHCTRCDVSLNSRAVNQAAKVHTNSAADAFCRCVCVGANEAFCDGGTTTRVLVPREKVCGLFAQAGKSVRVHY